PDDVDAVALRVGGLELFARYGAPPQGIAGWLRGAMARGEGIVIALDALGAPVGFAWFLLTGTFGAGGYLRLIAVAPEGPSQGAGAALLGEVERRVAKGSRFLFLLVSDFNQAAQRFYEVHGYTQVGRLPAFVKDGIDELLFWKRLEGQG